MFRTRRRRRIMIYKYIIVREGAILFNEQTVHSRVACGMGQIFSAGFVEIQFGGDATRIRPYGKSDSIGVKSRPKQDLLVIEDFFDEASVSKYFGASCASHYEGILKNKVFVLGDYKKHNAIEGTVVHAKKIEVGRITTGDIVVLEDGSYELIGVNVGMNLEEISLLVKKV